MIEKELQPTKTEHLKAVVYEILIDPLLEKVRGLISSHISKNSTVVDIGPPFGTLRSGSVFGSASLILWLKSKS